MRTYLFRLELTVADTEKKGGRIRRFIRALRSTTLRFRTKKEVSAKAEDKGGVITIY